MTRRRFIRLAASTLCLAVVPVATSQMPPPAVVSTPTLVDRDKLPTAEEFAELARRDPLGMLTASLSRYRCDVRGYSCTMEKRECVKGTLGPKEVIEIAFRDDPFAVVMKWKEGAGLAKATVYVKGENKGNLLAKTLFGVSPSDPNGFMARQNSRFSIQDFGIYRGTVRTYAAWKRAADTGRLSVEYLGTKPVPECDNRVCHVVRRTCDPTEVDNFSMADADVKAADKYPKEAIKTITLMFDAETFLHVGSDIRHPDGSLIASYYFRGLKMNPTFDREQFLRGVLEK